MDEHLTHATRDVPSVFGHSTRIGPATPPRAFPPSLPPHSDVAPLVPTTRRRTHFQSCARYVIALALRVSIRSIQRGRIAPALRLLRGLVAAAPRVLVARVWLARAAALVSDDTAVHSILRADVIDPQLARSSDYFRVAQLHLAVDDPHSAERYAMMARALFPTSPLIWRLQAQLHVLTGNLSDAAACFRKQSDLEPTMRQKVKALQYLADALSNAGDRTVESVYRELLTLAPQQTASYFGLVDCQQSAALDDPLAHSIRSLLVAPHIPPLDKRHLHYALGTISARAGDAPAAFAHFIRANQLHARCFPPFDVKALNAAVDARCQVFTRPFIQHLSQYGCRDDFLICIVGMPRSGTTLLSQLLSACDTVHALGERTDFCRLAATLPAAINSKKPYPYCCRDLSPDDIARLASNVRERFRRLGGASTHLVTKYPFDHMELGLIAILFPNARIVHSMRAPVDTCLSCFMQNFTSVHFASDLDTLAATYSAYRRIMEHWYCTLPTYTYMDVQYEHIVSQPSHSVADLCRFCGVPYEDRCLQFYERQSPVATASKWQVRQPIYRTSVNRSVPYREFLGPVLALEYACPPDAGAIPFSERGIR